MKIQAAVFYEPHTPFKIETLDLAPPRAGEVLVKIAAVGVCHSDWHLMTGATKHPVPVVPGHEGAGMVEAVGPGVTRVKPGDHVALNWAPNCGVCFYCLNDRPSLCAAYVGPIWAGTMMDGTTRLSKDGQPVYHFSALAAFAEYTVVPQECCVPLRKEVPFTVAALIGCAVTTGVGAVLNTAKVRPGSSVAVFGAGGVGLSIIMGAQLAGAGRIIAVDRAEGKLEMARSFGATEALIAGPDTNDAIRALTEGRGADYVFEAIGLPAVQEQCLDAARPGGVIVLAGISAMGSATNLPGAIITRQEKTVTGSYYGTANTARDFPLYADLYLRGKLDLERLVSKTYSLDQINEAYADMLSGALARGVIVF
jgi:NDMA-dependent alcohol dehydrogenase